ncbi:hypothetical protein AB0A66_32390 [Streptomyces longwoodensis]
MAGRDDAPRPTDAAWAEQLLDHLRPGADVGPVVDWLAAATGAAACLYDDTGTVLAGTALPLERRLLADIAAGRLASAAAQDGGRHVRLVRVALPPPASAGVLALARTAPFDRRASDVVTRTATVLELLLRARETAAAGHRLERATADLRLAVLQLLMVEDVVAARRVAAGFWPGLLDTDTACVYVMETGPGDRDRLAEECRTATGERALVVRCPAVDAHVIVVAPHDAEGARLRAVHAQTVRDHVRGAEPVLERQLLASGSDLYEVVLAHLAARNLAVPALPRTQPDLPGAPVHG